jgi:nucleoside-diphosphate-sugar epimerase
MIACTGTSGSIGRHLVTGCAEEVIQLNSRLEADVGEMVSELKTKMGDRPLKALIHLAAMTSVIDCERDPTRAFTCNVEGTLNWLRAATQVGCGRFVFVSTGHVFRPTSSLEWLSPGRPKDAIAVYGRSKALAEERLQAEATIDLTIARVFSVVGKGMRSGFLYSELERRAHERDFRPLAGYKNVRDFIDTRTAAECLVRLALRPIGAAQTGIFHVCSGVPRTVRELAVEVFRENGLADETEFATLFPETIEQPNFLVSKLSEI